MVSSSRNSRIKLIEKLKKSPKRRQEEGLFVVEGIKSVREAHHYCRVDSLYISEDWIRSNAEGGIHTGNSGKDIKGDKLRQWLIGEDLISREQDTKVEILSSRVFSQISDTVTPQGLLSLVGIPRYDLRACLDRPSLFLVILENLSDPGNMGTIIRTAEGAGADGIILSRGCVDVFSPKVVRSSMGALFRLPVFPRGALGQEKKQDDFSDRGGDFYKTLLLLKQKGIMLCGAHLKGELFYDEVSYGKRLGIVIGNESQGLTGETSELLDCLVKIPMEGKVESLNASVAAGILMYEVYSRKRKADLLTDPGKKL